MNIKFFEVYFEDGYCVCIKGDDKPTFKEAKRFLKRTMKQLGVFEVISINEITSKTARKYYGIEDDDDNPVFKKPVYASVCEPVVA